jgi:hypothetical protein
MTERIELLAEASRGVLKRRLSDADFVHLTCDGWSSVALDKYVTFTVHWIDFVANGIPTCTLNRSTLTTTVVHGSQTAEALADTITAACVRFGLVELPAGGAPAISRIVSITTDNGSNIASAASLLVQRGVVNSSYGHAIRCVAHTLQRTIYDAKVVAFSLFFPLFSHERSLPETGRCRVQSWSKQLTSSRRLWHTSSKANPLSRSYRLNRRR